MNNHEVLKEYHKYASESKKPTPGDIGFVGVGSCVYITRAKCQYTETKNKNGFHERVRWRFAPELKDTECELVLPTNEISTESGTRITIEIIDPNDIKQLIDEYIANIIRFHFNTLLLGFHGNKKIMVNGKKIEPFLPKETYHRIRDFKINDAIFKTYFYLTEKELPEEWRTINIVVGKKIVKRTTDFFKQPLGDMKNRVYGYIIADELINIITIAKDNFNKQTTLWKNFDLKATKEWIYFSKEIGVDKEEVVVDKITIKYENRLNQLMNIPKWKKIKDMLFNKIVIIEVPAKTKCPICGTEKIHTYIKDETKYECENCHIFNKKYTFVKKGHEEVEQITSIIKKPKTELKINYYSEKKDYIESRFYPPYNIAINMAMGTYQQAKRNDTVKDFYIRRCLCDVIISELKKKGFIEETDKETFFDLFTDIGC